ncbi:MAG: cell division protein FtsL [Syntrophales bacterium]|jgi:cell division protein FtsL|nr:cell division protein FtsL [Syntrophales bacterium]MCK9528611.1 cell division protein FtsL [Syntrophales bacterium]MDX9923052.1 cell division protein FtsL [Syntrophales bacterium]
MAGFADKQRGEHRFSHIVVGVVMIMLAALIYVWVQVNITKVNYAIAREMNRQEKLLEETRQLKIEVETLESPRRIEGIARETLKMRYPETSQVVILHD